MYVDKFFRTNLDPNGNVVVDPNLSILSIASKENELLKFAKENHITYLVLYDLHNVFGNPTYEGYLCDFMEKAKTLYCIEKIGVASSCASMFDNVHSMSPTPPFVFANPDSSTFQGKMKFLQKQFKPGTSDFYISEAVKLNLSASNFNNTCNYKFDVLVSEYEFWSHSPDDCTGVFLTLDEKYEAFQEMIVYMDMIRDNYNATHSDLLYVETYLGYLNQNLAYSDQDIADWIDGSDGGKKRVDRINLHYYANDPIRMYSRTNSGTDQMGYYQTRFNDFCQSTTETRTNIHPIMSAEYVPWGGLFDFLGPWFYQSVENNIFNAEKIWYQDWVDDATNFNPSTIGDSTLGNVIQPGGVQWFTSSQMVNHLNDPILFTSNSPVCVPAGQNGMLSFQYQGPIEQGKYFKFYITDTASQTIRCGGTDSIAWPAFDVTTNSSIKLDLALNHCLLPAGEYDVHLELTYNSECSTCIGNCSLYVAPIKRIRVVNSAEIIALTTTNVCGGSPVYLQASSSTSGMTSYQWNDNGIPIPGANGPSFVAPGTNTGLHNYTCNINSTISGCSANPSNSIPVSLSAGFTASISAQPASSCATILTASPAGASYLWSDGSTNQSFTTNLSGNYNVTVMQNGCSDLTSYTFERLNYNQIKIFNNCFGGQSGAIQLNIFGGIPPYTINYSGPVSGTLGGLQVGNNTISNLASGFYSLTIFDASGCVKYVFPDPFISNDHLSFWYRDADGDGYGDPLSSILDCNPPIGYVSNTDDCDDTDPAYNNLAGCPIVLNLKLFIQGFYKGAGLMRPVLYNNALSNDVLSCDSIIVELHHIYAPQSVAFARKILLNTDGTAKFKLPLYFFNQSYYIVIRHRNSLETWTAYPYNLSAYFLNYDFTTSPNKAYGSNQVILPDGKSAIWSGDIASGFTPGVQDGIINIVSDFPMVKGAVENFLTGYFTQDLTGDAIIESADFSILENNGLRVLMIQRP